MANVIIHEMTQRGMKVSGIALPSVLYSTIGIQLL